jgi:hydroxyethylthiazole kinase-like uncharacterized protein yjeF
MKVLSAQQLYKADQITIKKGGITAVDLMERAATLCFKWIHNRLQGNSVPIRVFCGTGNNGGDGLVIARHLKQHGYDVHTFIVNCGNKRSDAFLANYERLKEIGVWPEMISCSSELPKVEEDDMIIDAIFGLGLSRSPEGIIKETIQFINNTNSYVLSIDFPSGLFADKAVTDVDSVVKAYQTLTFQAAKLAFLLPDNQEFVGNWDVIEIGLDADYLSTVETDIYLTYQQEAQILYKFRNKFSHKGNYGHSLIIGGSFGKIGAVLLASRAALTIGSGLVTAYLPKCGYQIIQTALPEVMVEVDAENELQYFNSKIQATTIGIGIGMGTHVKTVEGFKQFLQKNILPLIVDADAINILSENKSLLKLLPENSVLTPHPKEFERLVGKWKHDFEKLDKLLTLSKKYKLVVVLKGAYTVIAFQGKLFFNTTGNPALATAGSGDVLTGVITGLIAQQYTPIDAAILGVYLHGKTADLAMNSMVYETFTASDSIEYLSDAYLDLFKEEIPDDQVKEENEQEKNSN